MFGRYNKAITAVVGAVIAFAGLVVFSEPTSITAPEWLAGFTFLAAALGVYAVPNRP